MLCIIRNLKFLSCPLLNDIKADFLLRFFEKTGIEFGDYVFCILLVGIEIGGVGPPNEKIM